MFTLPYFTIFGALFPDQTLVTLKPCKLPRHLERGFSSSNSSDANTPKMFCFADIYERMIYGLTMEWCVAT